jgi:sugar/nucleoside kinase (ribokinase family)
MFVIIGTTTADLLILSQEPLANAGGEGFQTSNLVFTDTPLRFLMGGNGGNSAYVLAGLGVSTALCSSVGRDPLGDTLVGWLETRGVNLDGLTRSDTQGTSTSVILMTDAANQVVFHHLGATAHIRLEDMPDDLIAEADVLLATSFSLIPNMRTGGYYQAIARTHQAGGITALDIGPAIGDPVTLDEIIPLLPVTHYLIANSHEINELTGSNDWEVAAAQLLDAGARSLVIKRGEEGASLRGSSVDVDVPRFEVKANVLVGAGDAFNVGFLYGVQQELPLEQAVRFGNAVAALVVSGEQGVMDSPTLVQVEEFLMPNG